MHLYNAREKTLNTAAPLVVKLGGSLYNHVPGLVPILRSSMRPLLISYVLEKQVDTYIINGSRPEFLIRYLRGDPVPGTRISTTF
jgi:aspartokinase-like uncharacterized kinase